MKHKYISRKNSITVHEYMEMCGLCRQKRKKERISHEAMQKKLYKRKEMFENITLPVRVSFDSYTIENVLKGEIVEVVDDFGNILPYENPYREKDQILLNQLKREATRKNLNAIREKLLQEQGYEILATGEIVTFEEAKEAISDVYEITGKPNRSKMFDDRGGRSLKRRRNII